MSKRAPWPTVLAVLLLSVYLRTTADQRLTTGGYTEHPCS